MSGKVATEDAVSQTADKYLKKLAPRKGMGDGPYDPPQPWLKDFYENGFLQLWEAVKRLEKISHNGEASNSVGGPVIVPPTGGPRPGPEKKPPPPAPAFP